MYKEREVFKQKTYKNEERARQWIRRELEAFGWAAEVLEEEIAEFPEKEIRVNVDGLIFEADNLGDTYWLYLVERF